MELINVLFKTVSHTLAKNWSFTSTIGGWLGAVATFCLSLFNQDAIFLTKIIWVALAIDFVFGTWTAIKAKKHVLSQAIILTAVKYAIYSLLFWLVVMAERGVGDTWFIASRLVFAFCMIAEIWSVIGHVAIINPRLVFIRLLRKSLAGEVARKLDMTEKEALAFLDGKEEDDKCKTCEKHQNNETEQTV